VLEIRRDIRDRSTSINEAIYDMERGLLVRFIDRAVANARVIRGAPETIALTAIIAIGMSYFVLQQFHRVRVAALNDTIASQERLLTEYRTKLKAAEEAEGQIEKLTSLLADAQKSLSAATTNRVPVENRARDPRRLYEDDKPIALVHDPKIDLGKRKITFPAVSAEVILGVNKSYEFQDWKLACGGTQLYSTVSTGSGREYSYAPLTCKILEGR
jgi:hypothetical protein